LVTKSCRYFM